MSEGGAGTGVRVGGRYRLEEKLGRGAMGVVWKAYDETLHRVVVVKEISVPHGYDRDAMEHLNQRMRREARLASQLEHPGIVAVHDFVEWDGRPWIVMAYLDGPSLQDVIRERGTLPPQLVAEIGVRLADALRAAHAAGVIHRDIKPANVILTSQGAVIVDFGIARAMQAEAEPELTMEGQIIGTPAYMAPEMIGLDHEVTPAADLWSLGATLFTAVEGRSPYGDRKGLHDIIIALASRPPAPAQNAGPMKYVLDWLLVKDPQHRMTAEQAKAALEAVVSGKPPATEATWPPAYPGTWPGQLAGPASQPGLPGTWPGPIPSAPRTRRLALVLGSTIGAAVLLVALGAVVFTVMSSGSGSGPTGTPATTPAGGPINAANYTLAPVAGGYRYTDAHFTAVIPSGWRPQQWFYNGTMVRFSAGPDLTVDAGEIQTTGQDVVTEAQAYTQSGRTGYRQLKGLWHLDTNLRGPQSWEYSYVGNGQTTVLAESTVVPSARGFLITTLSTSTGMSTLEAAQPSYHAFVITLKAL